MTPEEQERLNAETVAAAKKAAEKAAKQPAEAAKVHSLRAVYDGYAAKATREKPTEVNIVKNIDVEFTEDFGKHIKKGQKQSISQVAYEFYKGHGVVKIVKAKETEE